MAREILHNALFIAQCLICVWVVVWSIRHRGDFDERLSRGAQVLRWTVVVGGVLLASIPGTTLCPVRGVSLILSAAFLWWPNFAAHVMRVCGRGVRRH